MEMFYSIMAGSGFGCREAIYKCVEGALVIRDEGNHDNLAGNDRVCAFEGLTPEKAQEKIDAIMSEPVGHSYDGCHACTWSISIRKLDDDQVPLYLMYNEPSEAFAVKEALEIYRQKKTRI
jgi:hypothetical protein